MKEIELTQGKVALVDDEDFEYLNQWKWCAKKCPKTFYAFRSYWIGNGKIKNIYMHREIIKPKEKLQVDHINGDGLDNRRSNLRACSASQNQINSSARKRKSLYKGVYWIERKKRWCIFIHNFGKTIYGGSFKEEKDAAIKYNEMIKSVYGEFAKLNTII